MKKKKPNKKVQSLGEQIISGLEDFLKSNKPVTVYTMRWDAKKQDWKRTKVKIGRKDIGKKLRRLP